MKVVPRAAVGQGQSKYSKYSKHSKEGNEGNEGRVLARRIRIALSTCSSPCTESTAYEVTWARDHNAHV